MGDNHFSIRILKPNNTDISYPIKLDDIDSYFDVEYSSNEEDDDDELEIDANVGWVKDVTKEIGRAHV